MTVSEVTSLLSTEPDTHWLDIVGIGDNGISGLGTTARRALEDADILAGGVRHLAMAPDNGRPRLVWPGALEDFIRALAEVRGQRVCVLASGDPMLFGIGAVLVERFGVAALRIYPAPSSFSLAAARLGWPLREAEIVSVHGRPLALLHPHINPRARLLVLSADTATPAQTAALLCARGFGPSLITVLEHLDGPAERIQSVQADAFNLRDIADLNLMAIDCRAGPDTALRPPVPGLPDDAFVHDGQLTKREVRAVTLSALAPYPGARLWDIGAGCGSVAIEWMRLSPRNRALALEPRDARRLLIARNAENLGTPGLEIVAGRAPEALSGLRERFPPDAVFIGGGVAAPGVLDECRTALPHGARLVANAVTLEGEAALLAFHKQFGGMLTRLSIARVAPVGHFEGWRPLMPVTQMTYVKS